MQNVGFRMTRLILFCYLLVVYSMAPRSWKPDFSMSDSVPVNNVDTDDAQDERAASVMAYHAYRYHSTVKFLNKPCLQVTFYREVPK